MIEPTRMRGVGPGTTQTVTETQDVKTKDVQPTQEQGLSGIGTEEKETSQSSSKPENPAPRIDPKTIPERLDHINQVLSSSGNVDVSDLVLQIQQLTDAINRLQQGTQKVEIESKQTQIQKNIEDQAKKLSEAQEKMESQKTWDTFKDIFTYAALAVSVVAAVATGGVLAIALAGLGAALTIAQKTGGLDKAFDALGIQDQGWRTAITVGLSLALIAGSITNTAMIAKGVGEAATRALLPRMMEALGVLGKGVEAVKNVSQGIQIVAGIATSILKVGEGINQIGSAVAGKERDDLRNEGTEMGIKNTQLRQQLQELLTALKDLLKQLEDGAQVTTQTLNSQGQTMQRMSQRM